jgi:hypothetical protein
MLLDLLIANPVARRVADAGLVRFARRRTRRLDRLDVPAAQADALQRLVRRARDTRFGRDHHFDRVTSVADYQAAVPVRDYEAFWRDYWQDAFPRIEGTTWPEPVPYFALSSGTTSGTTKYIPVSRSMVASNRKGALTTVALFRSHFPEASLFDGRVFFLGGNTDLRAEANGSRSGDLTAIEAVEGSRLLAPYSFPPRELAGIADWEEKVTRLAEASARLPITAVSGVPSWLLVLFDRLKQVTGKARVADIWPRLRLVLHWGTRFDPYRDTFRAELGPDTKFCEVYTCSEAFIATEDPRYGMLRVVPDLDVFFEFIPVDDLVDGKPKTDRPTRHTLGTVEPGVRYAVAVTTCAGVWSYLIGDTVAFERRDPPLIRFTGRTRHFLSAFGEHLIGEELEKGVAEAARATAAGVSEFHVGPVFPDDPRRPGRHRYLVEFRAAPRDPAAFADALDAVLRRLNEDYDAHRKGDLTMLPPEVLRVRPGGFERWMLAHGKRPPQHKVPRMDSTGEQSRAIEQWMRANGEIE